MSEEPSPPEGTPPNEAPAPPPKKTKVVWTLVKLALAFGIIAVLVKTDAIKLEKLEAALAHPAWSLKALALVFACLAIITERWRLLLRIEGIDLSFADSFKLTIVGHFFNNVLPGAVTGDVVKMYYIGRKYPELRAEAYATVMIDRVVGLAALCYLAFGSALLNLEFVQAPGHGPLLLSFYGVCAAVAGFTGAIVFLAFGVGRKSGFGERVKSRLPEGIRRGYRAFIRLGERKTILFASFALGVLSHALLVIVAMTIGHEALGEGTLTAKDYYFVVPVGLFVNSIPVGLPGGLGVGEKAFDTLFAFAGAPSMGANVMILFRATQLAWGLVGALVYAFDRKTLSPPSE